MSKILTPEQIAEHRSLPTLRASQICNSHEALREELDVLNRAEHLAIDSGDEVAALIDDCLNGKKNYRWTFGEGSGECVRLAGEAVAEIERLRGVTSLLRGQRDAFEIIVGAKREEVERLRARVKELEDV